MEEEEETGSRGGRGKESPVSCVPTASSGGGELCTEEKKKTTEGEVEEPEEVKESARLVRQLLTCTLQGPRDVSTLGYVGTVYHPSSSSSGLLSASASPCVPRPDQSFVSPSHLASKGFAETPPQSLAHYLGSDFDIVFSKVSSEEVQFDLIGVDVAFANALRRTMLSEVPSVAIETVRLWQNTGVVQDEVLAHRLGLIPFSVGDVDSIAFRNDKEELSESNSIQLSLHVRCTPADVSGQTRFMPVYASHLKFEPWSQKQKVAMAKHPPTPVYPNILITKLRPGQEIELKGYLEKGTGSTHAKWSPVCTAAYRLQPVLEFSDTEPLNAEEARELKSLCPMGVFDLEDGDKAVARRPRNCTTCRACLERFPGRVLLKKDKAHFIFSVESTGVMPAAQIFRKAIQILRQKALKARGTLQALSERKSDD